ncbi:MAG: helix-turn-helix domain-containing protein [Planctomycetes bacterium]|nr:helix-turn-helix domain-containing protein [Planctomycetota bacterium]
MPSTRRSERRKLPGTFEELMRLVIPQAIEDDVGHENAVEMIDDLMAVGRPTKGQAHYLETLVQLVEAYEAKHHAIQTKDLRGIDVLEHLLQENEMNASDLARLLEVHPSMGSKILSGERSLTIPHIRRLADRFKVSPALFLP